MRRILLGFFMALGVAAVGTEARAQAPFGGINDPFFLYYGFYLPRQQAQALQSGPETTINAITAARQSYAATNRSDMFDPSGQAFNRFDLDSDFLSGTGGRGRAPGSSSQVARLGGNLNGRGVPSHFNRVGSYHPTLRSGQSRNANVSAIRGHSNFSGGGNLTPNIGLPGPR